MVVGGAPGVFGPVALTARRRVVASLRFMSAGRADRRSSPPADSSTSSPLSLTAGAITIRKNGVEFLSHRPMAPWTEVTVAIESPMEKRRVNCRAVVVACEGNRHAGYKVSLLFLGLTPQTQRRLESLALSDLG